MRKICNDFVEMWEQRCYHNGLPDEIPQEIFYRAPSYRLIAHAILKNDASLLGVVKKPCKSYIALKRIEIAKRRGSVNDRQLKFEL